MPIYEYQCDACHKTHEIWQRITEDPARECPDCAGALTRLISQTSFALQGTGWYKTDYVSGGGGDEGVGAAKAEATPSAAAATTEAASPAAAAPSDSASSAKKESTTPEPKSATTGPKSGTTT